MATREENLKKINTKLEQLSDEELEKIAGGTRIETFGDGFLLCDRGLIDRKDVTNIKKVSDYMHSLGYKYEVSPDPENNKYFNKKGESVTRDEFWDNFDAENGTKFIKFTT